MGFSQNEVNVKAVAVFEAFAAELDDVEHRVDILSERVFLLEARARGQLWALILLFLIVVMLATKVLTS